MAVTNHGTFSSNEIRSDKIIEVRCDDKSDLNGASIMTNEQTSWPDVQLTPGVCPVT